MEKTKTTASVLMGSIEAFRAIIADIGYDWPSLTVKDKQDIANRLSMIARQNPPWTWRYVHNVYMGMQPSKRFVKAFMAMGAMSDGIPLEIATAARVQVVAMGEVHQGSLILADSVQCVCGLWFVPRVPWQKYHAPKCRKRGTI